MSVNVSAFLESFICWAREQRDIEAVALVGSYARDAAVEGSDVDLVILTPNVSNYLRDRSWVSLFGKTVKCLEEDWGRVTSLRVVYEDGLEVEYGFTLPDWAAVPVDATTFRVVSDGMKSLYDPQNILSVMRRELLLGGE